MMMANNTTGGPDDRVVSRKFRNGTVEPDLFLINCGVDELSSLRMLVP